MLFLATLSSLALELPRECDWAVTTLFRMQRSDAPRDSPSAISRYVAEAYADQVKPFLPSKFLRNALTFGQFPRKSTGCSNKPRILDIGAGLALYHANLDHDLGGCVEHYLVDKSANEISQRNQSMHGGWHEKRLPFYNSMACARTIALANGIDGSRWHSLEASDSVIEQQIGVQSVDIAMSLLSCGWHYPTSTYAAALAKVLKPDGVLIITLRKGKNQLQALEAVGFKCVTRGQWAQSSKGDLFSCRRKATVPQKRRRS